jgi:hypothetical protein
MSDKIKHTVFVSYATPDRERISDYFEWLKDRGVEVWMDCQSIKPGQNWDFEIKRALDKSTMILMFVSRHSHSRRGYVQREIKLALDKLSEKLIDDIYVIPVLLDPEVEMPEQLSAIQYISTTDPKCKEKIYDALLYQFGRLGVQAEQVQRQEDLYWKTTALVESWDGLPGYDFQVQLFSFDSETYPNVGQIGEFLRGHFLASLFQQRADKLAQQLDFYNYGQDQFRRTNTYDAHSGGPIIKGRVLTLPYIVDTYWAGAPHPNHRFETFAFILDPLVRIPSLESIFSEPEKALAQIRNYVRQELYRQHDYPDHDEEAKAFTIDWIDQGTSDWPQFSSFVFAEDNLELLFAPYQVAAYVFGAQYVALSYQMIVPLMRPEIRSALGVEHYLWQQQGQGPTV